MADILVFPELRDGRVGKAAREAVSTARAMADSVAGEVHAVALGAPGIAETAGELGAFGADTIFVVEDASLRHYQPDLAAGAVADRAGAGDYAAIVFSATALGKDLAPRVAARLERGLAPDVIAWSFEDGALEVRRPMYAGKAIATIRFSDTPALVSLRPNAFVAEPKAGRAEVERIEIAPDARVSVTDVEQGERDRLDVAEATIVVSGGRGMSDPENWHLLEELVDALGAQATLGASRAVVDAGWRPHAEQVGQTGKTVSPNLYFAVGISGAIQHLAGMRTAKVIVAVNKDPEAPIFNVARYGLVGDVFEVLPRLSEEIRRVRSEH